MTRAYFGLGANLGDRWKSLSDALDGLGSIGRDVMVSRVYETAPVGGPGDQGAYLNCVVMMDTDVTPAEMLGVAHDLENAAGRVRLERFGPRTLDVDVLVVEGVTSDDPDLTLPHPRMSERAFVLAPLSDVDAALAGADWVERLGGAEVVDAAVRPVGQMLPVTRSNEGRGAA